MPGLAESVARTVAKRILPRRWAEALKGSIFYQRRVYRRHLATFEESAEPELAIAKRLVKPDDLVVDVGANIGVYTKFLSLWVGGKGTVISLEPVPRTYAFLRYNARTLGLGNVVTLPFALADRDGTGRMEVPRNAGGQSNIYLARLLDESRSPGGQTVDVQVRRLDSILGLSGNPSFIKIDVEGNELAVIMGAGRTLQRARPQLLIEILGDLDDTNTEAYSLRRLLCGMGYQLCVLDGDHIRRRCRGDRRVNYFFLTGPVAQELVAN
jgi:FkbM family methyltransferase